MAQTPRTPRPNQQADGPAPMSGTNRMSAISDDLVRNARLEWLEYDMLKPGRRAFLAFQNAPETVLIVKKTGDRAALDKMLEVATYLSSLGKRVLVEPKVHQQEAPNLTALTKETLEAVDLVITLGGDGTVMYAASLFGKDKPMPPTLSFAMGTLGFLTPFDSKMYRGALARVFDAVIHGTADSESESDGDLLLGASSKRSTSSEEDLRETYSQRGKKPYFKGAVLPGASNGITIEPSPDATDSTVAPSPPSAAPAAPAPAAAGGSSTTSSTSSAGAKAEGVGTEKKGNTKSQQPQAYGVCRINPNSVENSFTHSTSHTVTTPYAAPVFGSYDSDEEPVIEDNKTTREEVVEELSSRSEKSRAVASATPLPMLPCSLRYRMRCEVVVQGKVRSVHYALNEAVIERGPNPAVVEVECFIDGMHVTNIQADGLIISTPSGSTAYSLAAGGPMVSPSVACTIITPVAPFTLSFRPIVVPDTTCIDIRVPCGARTNPVVTFDGRDQIQLKQGSFIRCYNAMYPMSVITPEELDMDWYEGITQKLSWNQAIRYRKMSAEMVSEAEMCELDYDALDD